jgi:TetR/AcrR family transcriptional repressor of nem operon
MKKYDYYEQILKVAENLIQIRGYHAFSYRNIAEAVGIKTSSIHYYFPAKADLGKAVVKKHIDSLYDELEQLRSNKHMSYKEKLELFLETIFSKTYFTERKMCLGGMLASDVLTLPEIIQIEVRLFFNQIEKWLNQLLTEAIEAKEFKIGKEEVKNKALLII